MRQNSIHVIHKSQHQLHKERSWARGASAVVRSSAERGGAPLWTFSAGTTAANWSELELLRTRSSPRTTRDPNPLFISSLFSETLVDPESRRPGCWRQLDNRQNPSEGRETRVSEGPEFGSRARGQDTDCRAQ